MPKLSRLPHRVGPNENDDADWTTVLSFFPIGTLLLIGQSVQVLPGNTEECSSSCSNWHSSGPRGIKKGLRGLEDY